MITKDWIISDLVVMMGAKARAFDLFGLALENIYLRWILGIGRYGNLAIPTEIDRAKINRLEESGCQNH
jgi:hypothetical protein